MNILLVSQCQKGALKQTRRILDQFAERCGSRTWQTPITEAGLRTLKKLLCDTARKNTAVACHWIRGQNNTELLWRVGARHHFNEQGAVPTNVTERNILRAEDENDWMTAQEIRRLTQMAALLHDLGKASTAFQKRLKKRPAEKNLYRHEWVSLAMFQAFVGDAVDDRAWLTRLRDMEEGWLDAWHVSYDASKIKDARPLEAMKNCPLAQALGWLILSHHRLPGWAKNTPLSYDIVSNPYKHIDHSWNETGGAEEDGIPAISYWTLPKERKNWPMADENWQKKARRFATQFLALPTLGERDIWADPYILHLSRLCLMLADHAYSSLDKREDRANKADHKRWGKGTLWANKSGNDFNQTLMNHLLGVTGSAGCVAHYLPRLLRDYEDVAFLKNNRSLRKPARGKNFLWQNKAVEMASSLRRERGKPACERGGAFIVNMASTGCGKTLANAKILHALADEKQGLRLTYALGLRTLTLQTGEAYKKHLRLSEEQLAVRVGGAASRALYEFHQQEAEKEGSESMAAFREEEDGDVLFAETCDFADHPVFGHLFYQRERSGKGGRRDRKTERMIVAPFLVCTVDHLAPATESTRGGGQIVPMLRLMSSDLILDELDDYDIKDLPALTRLVYWTGLLGSRVLLSSATLPPALVEGMFAAYKAGRAIYERNHAKGGRERRAVEPDIACLWCDENKSQPVSCRDQEDFARHHKDFVERRVKYLRQKGGQNPVHQGEIWPIDKSAIGAAIGAEPIETFYARQILEAAYCLHDRHGTQDERTGRRVSFGLVRMANIAPLFQVARALFTDRVEKRADTHIHLCVYHARFPLIVRSNIEKRLDKLLNGQERDEAFAFIRPDLEKSDYADRVNHIFMILASPVCEVGRDWDADWAIAEPSSLRSLIQLSGRVLRHRARQDRFKPPTEPNIMIMSHNIKALKGEKPAFIYPGFEKKESKLCSYNMAEILREEDYKLITATPRIQPALNPTPERNLGDLEQKRIGDVCLAREHKCGKDLRGRLSPPDICTEEAALCHQYNMAMLTGILPVQQCFREDTLKDITLAWLPEEEDGAESPFGEEEDFHLHYVEKSRKDRSVFYGTAPDNVSHSVELPQTSSLSLWRGEDRLEELLAPLAQEYGLSLRSCAKRFAFLTLKGSTTDDFWIDLTGLGITKKRRDAQ